MSEAVIPATTKIHHELVIGGFGGQGVLKLGLTLVEAAMRESREVVWAPAYGPETRGGPSFCTVIISSERIGSPVVARADSAIIMDRPSLAKYQPRLRPDGLLLVNRSLVDVSQVRTDVRCYALPAITLAEEAGDQRAANMVMLGAFLHLTHLVAPETILAALGEAVSKRNRHLLPINERALALGAQHLEQVIPTQA